MTPITDFTVRTAAGAMTGLDAYRGKVLLIVNTASKCGFTPQYGGLQALWQRREAEGLAVIGVPSNDFGGQEPGDADEIGAFCSRNYGVNFPMTAKLHVRGPEAHPLFGWLGREGGVLSRPRWNFFKYVIGRDGRLLDWFTSVTAPGSARLQRALDRALEA